MLPPGHIAAGYLVAKVYETIFHPHISLIQSKQLLWLGALFGFLPDLDMFLAFFNLKSFTIQPEKADHRAYLTHIPYLWLLLGVIIWIIGKIFGSVFTSSIGIVLFLSTWSHFILDSIYFGVQWLWPFSKKCFALFNIRPGAIKSIDSSFFGYWSTFIKNYYIEQRVTAYLELLLIALAVHAILLN